MSKKNLPNIPIYIGDWERDCNVLDLASEAAWMRIVFKLWTKGKQNTIKIPTKSLQNLWRCDKNTMLEIIDDLIFNEICEISIEERFIEFTCRRFVKENKISEVRSEAAKGKSKSSKRETKAKQTISKIEQNSENENVNVNEDVNKNKVFNKKVFREKLISLGAKEQHVEDWLAVRAKGRSVFTKTAFDKFVNECTKNNFPVADAVKICAEKNWRGFEYQWIINSNYNLQSNQLTTTADDNR